MADVTNRTISNLVIQRTKNEETIKSKKAAISHAQGELKTKQTAAEKAADAYSAAGSQNASGDVMSNLKTKSDTAAYEVEQIELSIKDLNLEVESLELENTNIDVKIGEEKKKIEEEQKEKEKTEKAGDAIKKAEEEKKQGDAEIETNEKNLYETLKNTTFKAYAEKPREGKGAYDYDNSYDDSYITFGRIDESKKIKMEDIKHKKRSKAAEEFLEANTFKGDNNEEILYLYGVDSTNKEQMDIVGTGEKIYFDVDRNGTVDAVYERKYDIEETDIYKTYKRLDKKYGEHKKPEPYEG